MSSSDVNAFFDRVDSDAEFAQSLAAVREDSNAVKALIAEAGFNITPDEVRDAFLERFGDQLDEAQLAAIAGGLSGSEEGAIVMAVGTAGIGIAIGVVVAAAAI